MHGCRKVTVPELFTDAVKRNAGSVIKENTNIPSFVIVYFYKTSGGGIVMALIKCPECGKEISDKASACIHCGFPLSLIKSEIEKHPEQQVAIIKEENIPSGNGYSMELLDYGNKKVQVATALKSALKLKDVEALELVANVPCYLFKGKQEQIVAPIIKKLNTLPVEYKLYLNGELKWHKTKDEIDKLLDTVSGRSTCSNARNIKCPNCSSLIAETSRACPICGYDDIGSCLLNLEREKQAAYIDYTSGHTEVHMTQNVPKCPTCQSTDIKKISTASKAGSVFMWGLLSQKVKKQWHCNNCGSEW